MLKNNQISNAQKPSLLTIGLNFYVSLSLLLSTAPALANEPSIIADPGASNRPDILKAPNETLIINITNPDSKGVSINEYSRFNTPTTGTILNNSNKNIETKIAGQIDANYRLNKEASLIINKVNSAEKSSLKGNLEVAGSRADVVIANPNGISVDGLNMINSRSLTLTTGNINKLSPKEIELISNNSIDIVGDGLNDKSSDYTNVISNAVNLNSNIHANELNIIGEKALTSSKDRLYNDVKAKNQENSFSLDSSALGGMYANKIKLVGTSNGVGVNNNGLVIANNNIEISLDGDIVNAGAIASNKEAKIEAKTITNKDEALIAAKENLNIKADTLVNTSSQIYAKDINVDQHIDYNKVARATSGASGAELANIVNEAALRAVRMGRKQVVQEDLEESVETVIAGYQRKGAVINEREKKIIAYHEVGHALVAAMGKHSAPVHKITIIPRTSGALGYTMQVDEEEKVLMSKEEALDKITTYTGGRAAEEVIFNTKTSGASNDIEMATRFARSMVTRFGMDDNFGMVALETVNNAYLGGDTSLACSPETSTNIDKAVIKIISDCHQRAVDILMENIDKLHEIAEYLLQNETITGDEFMDILDNNYIITKKADFIEASQQLESAKKADLENN